MVSFGRAKEIVFNFLCFEDGGCGIPVMTLVFGGGFDVIENVAERTSNGMPVIICGSTGGAAEVLQRVYQYKNKRFVDVWIDFLINV